MIFTKDNSGQVNTKTPCTPCQKDQGIFAECLKIPGGEWHGACGNCIRRGHATRCSARDMDEVEDRGPGNSGGQQKKAPTVTRSGRVSKPGDYPTQHHTGFR
jgi:hypothetical protein